MTFRLQLHDGWTEERAARVAARVQRRVLMRGRLRRVGLATLAVAVACLGGALALRPGEPAKVNPALHLVDGSVVTPAGRVVVLEDRLDAVRVRLEQGGAHFVVVKRPSRRFVVDVAPVRIEVIGTRFAVVRDAETVRVFVEEGRVVVFTAAAKAELGAGQFGAFSLAAPEAAVVAPDEPELEPEPEPSVSPEPSPARLHTASDWRPLARRGDFDRAWPLLSGVRNEPKDLLLASDVARLTGHPREARKYLQQLVGRHPKDPRAPLAAFTLGRVLLEELGWPRDAAAAFARTVALDPQGPLAEDALAREVEAWSRAGELERARAAAQAYLEKYPRGQRAAGVRRHGGL